MIIITPLGIRDAFSSLTSFEGENKIRFAGESLFLGTQHLYLSFNQASVSIVQPISPNVQLFQINLVLLRIPTC